MIIDSHCHVSLAWYEPVETLLHEMDANGVERAVLIQIMGQFDNTYQFECARRHADRLANVVLVDAQQPDAVQTLERLAAAGASGLRLPPTTRSPGEDPLAIWRAAERLGLAVSCGGTSSQLESELFRDVVRSLPTLRIVIEHLASVSHRDTDDVQVALRHKAFELAEFHNVYIKVTGLGEFCERALPVSGDFPFVRPIPPLMQQAYAAFGPGRMMWGSDFPPVAGREGYRQALRLAVDQFADKTQADRDLVFGGTALSVFWSG